MIHVKEIGPWTRVGQLLAAAPRRVQAAFDQALLQEAHFLRSNEQGENDVGATGTVQALTSRRLGDAVHR